MLHQTVLLKETVTALAPQSDDVVVDATLGSGGHAKAICELMGKNGHFIGIDVDEEALSTSETRLAGSLPRLSFLKGNFKDVATLVESVGVSEVDAIVADLGWRMEQFSEGGRGLSFRATDEPLLMTLGNPTDYPFTAMDIVNDWEEGQIQTIIAAYGEERFARRIAKAIVSRRETELFATVGDLVTCIEGSVPAVYRHGRIHPATRTFQALRMAVNDELTVLDDFMTAASGLLSPGGRLAIITFHSLEDRLVKHRFRELAAADSFTILTKRPVIPTSEEVQTNPRARSAKLRIISRNI